ncbi:hypothetical protein EON66_07585 [archaeon]|nr:MAG: hypothetical protein EON66_07585 [archaeon]
MRAPRASSGAQPGQRNARIDSQAPGCGSRVLVVAVGGVRVLAAATLWSQPSNPVYPRATPSPRLPTP